MTGFVHHIYHTVERNTVVAIGKGGIDVGIQSTGSSVSITLDARNLHQATNRVASHAQVMLQSHFSCIFNLIRTASKELASISCCHSTGYTHLTLTTHIGT